MLAQFGRGVVKDDRSPVDASKKVLKPRVRAHFSLRHSVCCLDYCLAVGTDVCGVCCFHDPWRALLDSHKGCDSLELARTPELHVRFQFGAAVLDRNQL